tara:strand:- start:148 stop:303 length:156 start_codon:yes stop_codon:yes gene_type:complete
VEKIIKKYFSKNYSKLRVLLGVISCRYIVVFGVKMLKNSADLSQFENPILP